MSRLIDTQLDGNGDIILSRNDVEIARVDGSGNVATKGTVNGGSYSATGTITIQSDSAASGTGDIVFQTDGTAERLRITNAGLLHSTGSAYFDSLGLYTNHNAFFNIRYEQLAPTAGNIFPALFSYVDGLGDSAGNTFRGVAGASFTAADASSVAVATKGVLYGLELQVTPALIRNNSPYDDATGLIITNNGVAMATDCIYIAHNSSGIGAGNDWDSVFTVEAHANELIKTTSTTSLGYGLKLDNAAISSALLTGPNNVPIQMKNAGGTLKSVSKLNASDVLELYGGAATLTSAGTLAVSALSAPTATGYTGQPLGGAENYLMPTGTLITSLDPGNAAISAALGLLASGTTRLVRGGFPVPTKVTNFNFVTGTQAAVAPSHWWAVILDTSGTVLAVTGDQLTGAIAANTVISIAFSPATVIPAGPFYYGVMVAVGTTMPNVAGLGSLFNAVTTGFPVRGGASTTTGSTTPPAVSGSIGIPTAESTSRPWFWLT